MNKILVNGGGGYLGSVLVPKLLAQGYSVRVLDTFYFGNFLPFDAENLEIIKGDIRNEKTIVESLTGIDKVINLACLSNDPSSDIDPELTRDINYTANKNVIRIAHEIGVKRFIYASSSSVYGLKSEENVTEDLPVEPISLYSELKARVENYLLSIKDDNFTATAVRSATICGYSPRMRLDLLVNILTVSALANGRITIDGGDQVRANIHIGDISNFYMMLLDAEHSLIHNEAFNISDSNSTVIDMANKVQSLIKCKIEFSEKMDPRSYKLNDDKARRVLNFKNCYSIEKAILDIKRSFFEGRIRIDDVNCYNIKKLLLLSLPFLKTY
ncbi:MAG: SDR family oxidoreductase [Ignavibacteriae bacterium]|nr:MAG: SDR family oxidoreductase [Ignavibacteriota bacterium]